MVIAKNRFSIFVVADNCDDDTAKVTADPVPADAEETAKQAAEDCPVEAITIE